jgi:hypothetical protein
VMEVHGLFVDVGLEGVVGVGQWGQFVSHLRSPLFAFGPGETYFLGTSAGGYIGPPFGC